MKFIETPFRRTRVAIGASATFAALCGAFALVVLMAPRFTIPARVEAKSAGTRVVVVGPDGERMFVDVPLAQFSSLTVGQAVRFDQFQGQIDTEVIP